MEQCVQTLLGYLYYTLFSEGSPDEGTWKAPSGTLATSSVTSDDLKTMADAVEAIRLTAAIVDTPTNEMNVDHFLEVT